MRELFPGTLVAPALMIGATDSRHFDNVADRIYRFSPARARPEDLPRLHGTNERIDHRQPGRARPLLPSPGESGGWCLTATTSQPARIPNELAIAGAIRLERDKNRVATCVSDTAQFAAQRSPAWPVW